MSRSNRLKPNRRVRLALLLASVLLSVQLFGSACALRPAPTAGPDTSPSTVEPSITTALDPTDSLSPTESDSETSGSESSSMTGPDSTSTGLTSDVSTTGSLPGDPSASVGTGTSNTSAAGPGGTAGSTQPGTVGPIGTVGTKPSGSGTTVSGTSAGPVTTTSRPPQTTQPTTQATTTKATTQTPTTQATTQAPTTTQGGSGSFPVHNYGTFFRNEYGQNAQVVSSEDGAVSIDVGSSRQGVVLVRVNTPSDDKRWKGIIKGPSGSSYQYDLLKRGSFEGVPLQLGNGSYTLTVYEQVSGTSYSPRMAHTFSVSLASSLSPYLAASIIVNFSSSSPSTARAASLVSGKSSQVARIEAVYQWVVQNIAYDRALAGSITSGQTKTYIPSPDTTMSTRKGICYDYAALMAAMLRSQGIPTRLIMGRVPQGYHAWNEVYIAGTGWVVIAGFNYKEVDGSAWAMFDATFAAGGMSSQTILSTTHTKERTY